MLQVNESKIKIMISNEVEDTSIELRGGTVTLMSLQLFNGNLEQISHGLKEKISQAPGFFKNTPVILDLQHITEEEALDISGILEIIRQHDFIPIAARGADDGLLEALQQNSLPNLRKELPMRAAGEKRQDDASTQEGDEHSAPYSETSEDLLLPFPPLMINRPLRSGQQVYARERDLVLTTHSSPGAELIADGSIHVYGALRGRALCGVTGNREARIFCQRLEADLVSVAGNYKLIDDADPELYGKAVQIWLEDDKLCIEALA